MLAWLFLAFNSPLSKAESNGSFTNKSFIDVHMHLDGMQSSGANRLPQQARERSATSRRRTIINRQGTRPNDTASADSLIETMDEYGVQKAIVMPPPQNPDQRGAYQYSALFNSIRKYPDRLALGAGGGTLNPMIQGTKPSEVTEGIRDAFKAKAKEIIGAGAHVFAEMAALHVCLNRKHHYVAAPPDHPLFLLLADLAAQYDIAIDLHMEAVQKNMPTPGHLLRACDKNPETLPATIPAFERLLDHNPKARIVWQHIGWDNTGQMTPSLLRRLLKQHSNLYLAIKAVSDPNRKNRIHDDAYNILPEWRKLFASFPDRIVVGSDEFARSPRIRGGYKKPQFFKITWQTVNSLPDRIRNKIGNENPRRIYNLK